MLFGIAKVVHPAVGGQHVFEEGHFTVSVLFEAIRPLEHERLVGLKIHLGDPVTRLKGIPKRDRIEIGFLSACDLYGIVDFERPIELFLCRRGFLLFREQIP